MSSKRKVVFVNNEYYHIYNRGIDRRDTFTNKREFSRALDLLWFYQYKTIPMRYSQFISAPVSLQQHYMSRMKAGVKLVEVVAYCLMPNHFHLLLSQKQEKGISIYLSNFMNAYTKYFNLKYERIGPLFQGVFKGVYIESENQLVHLIRYIHLNPVVSPMVLCESADKYPWSSHKYYVGRGKSEIVDDLTVQRIKYMIPEYEKFVNDHISYAKELEKIKHLILD